MLLQIDGWFGGGKSVLWALLQGHPKVFCSPIHDYSFSAFLDQNDNLDWVTTQHTEILRKILAKTQFYKLEKVSWDGFTTLDFSSEDRLKIPFKMEYYKFDYNFIKSLKKLGKWDIETIIDTLYGNMNIAINHKRKINYGQIINASMSNPLYIEFYKNFPNLFPHGKSIQVRRGVESILATRSNRKPMPEDFKTKNFYSDPLHKRIEQGEVEKILNFYYIYDNLVQEFPNQFITIDFEQLTSNPEPIMHNVCNFLGIEFTPNLLIATHGGKELICNGKKYIGQVHDNIDNLLTKEEQMLIAERVNNFQSNK